MITILVRGAGTGDISSSASIRNHFVWTLFFFCFYFDYFENCVEPGCWMLWRSFLVAPLNLFSGDAAPAWWAESKFEIEK